MSSSAFLSLLRDGLTDAIESEIQAVNAYRELVKAGNRKQNLTRLTSPGDFYYGHVADIIELLRLNWVVSPALDVGSGCGVPGLLSGILDSTVWVLTESEGRKAEFLSETVAKLGLEGKISVFDGRAEAYLYRHPEIRTLVARAVAPVGRLLLPIRKSSTWNNIVLFKGPTWETEWAAACQNDKKLKRDFVISSTHHYVVGPDRKRRVLLDIHRR